MDKTLRELTIKVIKFRDSRNWKQFHTPKDVALSIVLEAAELMEHFQWKNEQEQKDHSVNNKELIGEEISDVLFYLLLLSNDLDIDITDVFKKKLTKSAKKYPVKKAKGNHKKYTELNDNI
jgi:dCTP diphosphatase